MDLFSKDQKLILTICKCFIHNQKIDEATLKESGSRLDFIDENKLSPILFKLSNAAKTSGFSLLIAEKLKEIRLFYGQRKKIQLEQILAISKAFKKEGITINTYKGLAFTKQFYPNISFRDSIDIDFSLEPSQISRMGKIMSNLNYKEAKGDNDFENVKLSRGYYIDYSWLLYTENNIPMCNAEFHWQAANSALYVPLNFSLLSEETVEVPVADESITTYNKTHQALILLCHHGIVDGWGKIRHLVDLTQVDKTLNQNEWKKLIELSKQYKVHRSFLLGCNICAKLFDYEFKNEIDFSSLDKLANKMIPKIMSGDLKLKWSEQPKKFLYYIQMRDSFADKLKSIFVFGKFSLKEIKFKRPK